MTGNRVTESYLGLRAPAQRAAVMHAGPLDRHGSRMGTEWSICGGLARCSWPGRYLAARAISDGFSGVAT